MDFVQEPAFWWALIASIWAVTSDWLGSNPRAKDNATYQLVLRLISQLITGQAKRAGRNRWRR